MRKVKLEEIFEIARGGSPRPIKKFVTKDPNGINWIKIGDTTESKYITKTKEKIIEEGVSKSRYVEPGDFLLTNSMSFGRPYILKIDGCIHDGWLVLKPKSDQIFEDYIYYILGSPVMKREFKKKAKGTTVKNLNISLVSDVEIPLPSLSEQKAIVAKLDRAQRLIDIDKDMLAKYDELIQSVFLEMFGDPVTNSKGWERVPFKKLAEIDKESFDPTDFQGSVEYIGLNSIVKDSGKIIDVETITEGDVKSNKYRFSPDHILYGKLRPYLNKVAFPDFNGVCSTDILPIKARDEISTKYFVGYLLKTKEFVSYADKNSSGANLPRISPTMVKKFEAFLPPLELQNKFDDLVNKIISEKQQTAKASQKSEELFSSLVQGAFG